MIGADVRNHDRLRTEESFGDRAVGKLIGSIPLADEFVVGSLGPILAMLRNAETELTNSELLQFLDFRSN